MFLLNSNFIVTFFQDLDTRFEKGRDEYSDEDEEDEEVEEEEEEAQRRSLAHDSDEQDDRSADGSDEESDNLSLRAQMVSHSIVKF